MRAAVSGSGSARIGTGRGAEFLANAMKEFFADERVKKTLVLIDWGRRRVPLLPPTGDNDGKVVVDRLLQAQALRPHSIPSNVIGGDDSATTADEDALSRFKASEVAIRDCYDGFLDGLETLASYVETSLFDAKALRPYLGYWMNAIQQRAEGPKEAAWKAALLTYISYYKYPGVVLLFCEFDYDIAPSGATYRQFLTKMENQAFASALAASVNRVYPAKTD
jgi:hypothetical protein